jgi:secretion/DNA translocation related TadE-like protein
MADEAGSAAALATALAGVLAIVTMLVTVVAGAVTDQRRLEAAADLGALAGASAAQRGEDACAAAGSVTDRNGGHVTACSACASPWPPRPGAGPRRRLRVRWADDRPTSRTTQR